MRLKCVAFFNTNRKLGEKPSISNTLLYFMLPLIGASIVVNDSALKKLLYNICLLDLEQIPICVREIYILNPEDSTLLN